MRTCTHLSDRMPDVALGRAHWTADEEHHLAGCDDCRAEWALVSAGSRLGTSLLAADVEHTAARVLDRLREARPPARRRLRLALVSGLAAAAVAALAVWTWHGSQVPGRGGSNLPSPVPVASTPAAPSPAADSQMRRPREPDLAQASLAGAPVDLPLPELDSLPVEVLDSLLKALDEPLAHVGAYDLAPDESGDRELEQVLAGLEG